MLLNSGAGTDNPSGAPELISGWLHVAQSLVFCIVFCSIALPYCLFLLAIELSVLLQFMVSDCHFGKLFLYVININKKKGLQVWYVTL